MRAESLTWVFLFFSSTRNNAITDGVEKLSSPAPTILVDFCGLLPLKAGPPLLGKTALHSAAEC